MRRLTLTIPNLPPSLNSFLIAYFPNIYVGLWTRQEGLERTITLATTKPSYLVDFYHYFTRPESRI